MDSLQTNFILLGYPRCGSTLLSFALASHRHVRMYLELFHHDPNTRRSFYRADKRVTGPDGQLKARPNTRYYHAGERGDQFLQDAVYYDRDCDKPLAVGFKLFYNHAREDENVKTAWDFLLHRRNIRVINLVRQNLLDVKLSRERARLTGQWTKHVGDTRQWGKHVEEEGRPPDMSPLVLDPSDCDQFFNRVLAYRAWVTRAFCNHPFLEITYEDNLCGRFEDTMLTLQGFLSIPARDTKVLTEKQSTLPTKLQIQNYDQLREYFRHTIHQAYFID